MCCSLTRRPPCQYSPAQHRATGDPGATSAARFSAPCDSRRGIGSCQHVESTEKPAAALPPRSWITLERLPDDPLEARRRAEALGAQADAARLAARRTTRAAKGHPATAADHNPYPPGTVSWLIRRWAGDIDDRNTPGASPEWRRLADRTRRDYRGHLQALRELFGRYPLTALTPRAIYAYKAKLSDPATGLMSRQRRYDLQVLQALCAYGVAIGSLASNPATKLRLPGNPPRRAYWTEENVAQFLAADPPPSIRLALMLGLWTGQRQADILNLRWSDMSVDREGRSWISLEQRKSRRAGRTAKRVEIPISETLAAELAKADRTSVYVVSHATTGRPYHQKYFRDVWRTATPESPPGRLAVPRPAPLGCGKTG
jgi:hypothetical protein